MYLDQSLSIHNGKSVAPKSEAQSVENRCAIQPIRTLPHPIMAAGHESREKKGYFHTTKDYILFFWMVPRSCAPGIAAVWRDGSDIASCLLAPSLMKEGCCRNRLR